ncbi:MAG: hypothetical protein HYV42_05595 [Candidatus Magasanikbacteria bacterium]|nr:hypothetical protein [Candidatus Magasanikbacteria bacterium]
MTALSLIFTLAAIGVSETVYLIRTRVAHEQPVCPIGGGSCTVVLESKYNHLLGIRNDFLGLAYYIITASIAGLLVVGVEPLWFWGRALPLLIAGGALFSVFLTYLQGRVIRAWCFWCLMSALTTWLMTLIILMSKTI